MLGFSDPVYLWLLVAVPPLLFWWLRQRGSGLRHPDAGLLSRLPAARSRWARQGGALFRGLALTLLIVALAGPRWPDRRTRIDTDGIALQLTVDTSGSMGEIDFDWDGLPLSRLDAVKRVVALFVTGGDLPDGTRFEGRPTDLVGLVTFGTRPDCPCPLTLSHGVLLRALDETRPLRIPGESETNLSDALVLALHRLEAAGSRRKVLVLLSDGEHNVPVPPSGLTPRQVAQLAGNLGVRVHTIDAGNETLDTTNRAEAVRNLHEIAHVTGGRSFSARDTEGLVAVWREIDAMERDRVTSFQYRRYHEGFWIAGLASFVVWMTVAALELTVWRRLP